MLGNHILVIYLPCFFLFSDDQPCVENIVIMNFGTEHLDNNYVFL